VANNRSGKADGANLTQPKISTAIPFGSIGCSQLQPQAPVYRPIFLAEFCDELAEVLQ
jgi:hypothetical protein